LGGLELLEWEADSRLDSFGCGEDLELRGLVGMGVFLFDALDEFILLDEGALNLVVTVLRVYFQIPLLVTALLRL